MRAGTSAGTREEMRVQQVAADGIAFGRHWPWYLAGLVVFLSFGYTEMAGSDLWWNVAGGREILDQGTLWLRDTWSYTAEGERWRNHEWLADLIFFAWQQVFSLQALVYWKWLMLLAIYGVLQGVLHRLGGDRAAALVLSVLALAIAAPFIDVRPQLYSFLGFVLLLYLCQRRAPFWQLALLFLCWVNLHGGFFFGLLILPLLLFPFDNPSFAALRRTAAWTAGCVAVCLINPDGIKVVLYPLTYALQADSPYRQLAEWQPPWTPGGIRSPLFFWALPLLPVILLCYALPPVRRLVPVPWWCMALAVLTLAMACTSRRFIPFYGIALAVVAAPLAGALCRRFLPERAYLPVLAAALLFGLVRLWPYPLAAGPALHYLTAEYSYPRDTVDAMLANDLSGRVFAYYNWGGYLHLRSDGRLQVYIDGRANTLYDDETYLNYVAVLRGDPGWIGIVEDSGADYFLWPMHLRGGAQKVRELMETGRWQPLYQGGVGVLMVRRKPGLPRSLSPGPATPIRQLSIAQHALWRGQLDTAESLARQVLDEFPWERNACSVVAQVERRQRGQAAAEVVLESCRDQFPSRYLR